VALALHVADARAALAILLGTALLGALTAVAAR